MPDDCCLLDSFTDSTSRSLKAPKGLYVRHSVARSKSLHGKCLSPLAPLSLACGSGLRGPLLKKPKCRNIGRQIESTLNCENSLVWSSAGKSTPDSSGSSLAEALDAHWNKPVIKENRRIVSSKWQYEDLHKKLKWANEKSIRPNGDKTHGYTAMLNTRTSHSDLISTSSFPDHPLTSLLGTLYAYSNTLLYRLPYNLKVATSSRDLLAATAYIVWQIWLWTLHCVVDMVEICLSTMLPAVVKVMGLGFLALLSW